jgi:hypothetical protein
MDRIEASADGRECAHMQIAAGIFVYFEDLVLRLEGHLRPKISSTKITALDLMNYVQLED